jgi:hypothetical protein
VVQFTCIIVIAFAERFALTGRLSDWERGGGGKGGGEGKGGEAVSKSGLQFQFSFKI